MRRVEDAERPRLFTGLQQAHPAEFKADEASRALWHREQAIASELTMEWDAAAFHWERTREGKVESRKQKLENGKQKVEIPVESRLAYAREAAEAVRQAMGQGRSRWSVILPRQPWAAPEMLDLGRFYAKAPGEPLVADRPSAPFRALGNGVLLLGGTGFDVRGVIQPDRTKPVTIPVSRACQRLHFLHASNQTIFGREPVGAYLVRYVNGDTLSVELVNPDDLPPFCDLSFYAAERRHKAPQPDRAWSRPEIQSSLAWCGSTPTHAAPSDPIQLTRTTWTLPTNRWDQVVQSIELRAGPGGSAPLIFAITLE